MIKKTPSAANRLWVEHLSPSAERKVRIFCFPYAGGSANVFRGWQRGLPPQADLCLVHLPGRARRIGEPLFTELPCLVKTIADVIFDEPMDPFVFYGHSMGAMISFELARELRRRDSAGPRQLFLSGRRAPTAPNLDRRLFDLPEAELIMEIDKLKGTPPELLDVPEVRELFMPLLRADFQMVDTYVYRAEEPLSCPITVYGGMQDEFVPVESLREWQKQTSASFRLRMLPGGHFFVTEPRSPFVDALQQDILQLVGKSDQPGR